MNCLLQFFIELQTAEIMVVPMSNSASDATIEYGCKSSILLMVSSFYAWRSSYVGQSFFPTDRLERLHNKKKTELVSGRRILGPLFFWGDNAKWLSESSDTIYIFEKNESVCLFQHDGAKAQTTDIKTPILQEFADDHRKLQTSYCGDSSEKVNSNNRRSLEKMEHNTEKTVANTSQCGTKRIKNGFLFSRKWWTFSASTAKLNYKFFLANKNLKKQQLAVSILRSSARGIYSDRLTKSPW